MDSVTRKWIRNVSDERAAENGCWFDEEQGEYVVKWIADYCRLYEGEWAGESLVLSDWQLDATMRLFGWMRDSERWGRPIRRFRQASIWVPKKNKKSPTLAAWGLYLLCGDGEPGQKIFLAAKDGNQAREIAGKHAYEMMMASDELRSECKTNLNSMQISHLPSRSLMKPLSSANSRHQQGKEGLNGSVLIDETHVVDREFVGRISRAGISRSEPLQIEVSTAGDDPEGYGKERFEYGAAVERGDLTDERLFYAAYAAPQDLSDEELAADPIKWGRIANPAMGHTVDPEEFMDDYNRSRASLAELGRFKMYRLNIWQKSASPWLRSTDWNSCLDRYTEEDLEGQICYAGLDLSKTTDTTSLQLIFPSPVDSEECRLISYFWLPENKARELADQVGYLEWEKDGYIELTPGDVVDYRFIRRRLNEIREKFDLQILGYDKTYAEPLRQDLVQDDGWPEDVPQIFPQTIMYFAGPTAEFERRVIAGKLRHNGNACMNWQIGHTTVKPDANGNKRPVKPKQGDKKKIDGPVAAIMALGLSMESEVQNESTISFI